MKNNNTADNISDKRGLQRIVSIVITSVFTIVGLIESLETETTCYVFIASAIMLGLLAFALKKKYPEHFWNFLLNAGVIIVLSFASLIYINNNRVSGALWYESMRVNDEDAAFLRLIDKADGGDGVAQAQVSDYYHNKKDYNRAFYYASKAANNDNAQAYARLALYRIWGLGCKVDVHEGVSNMISALQRERIDFSPLLQEMGNKGIVLSPEDSDRLSRRLERSERMKSIYLTARSILIQDGWFALMKYIDENAPSIEDASDDGYRPATELLYIREFYKNRRYSQDMYRATFKLYQCSYIPTSTIDRAMFFQSFYQDDHYTTEKYQQYIDDGDFAFLFGYDMLIKKATPVHYQVYSNKALLDEYELFRAQYDWCKDREDGKFHPVYYIWGTMGDNGKDVFYARELLRKNIAAVQKRMDSPVESIDDMMESTGIEITISTPWGSSVL